MLERESKSESEREPTESELVYRSLARDREVVGRVSMVIGRREVIGRVSMDIGHMGRRLSEYGRRERKGRRRLGESGHRS